MTHETQFISKQSLIKAIEDATVDIEYCHDSKYVHFSGNHENVYKVISVVDAHKLLEVLKNV
jgi:hypothetical protein